MGGHLDVIKWARANDCPWDEDICSLAAQRGHLDVLKWARANGCPRVEEHWHEIAMRCGHVHILEWMEQPNEDT